MVQECDRCDEPGAKIRCSCGKSYCDDCWVQHKAKKPDHKKAPPPIPSKFVQALNWIRGSTGLPVGQVFEQDETAKWFGLVEEIGRSGSICQIIETSRFSELMEASRVAYPDSPKRQYPSMIAFVGDTSAGKSTLIRSLIRQVTTKREILAETDAPVSGDGSSLQSTTGETLRGLRGFSGTSPAAAEHQKKWNIGGRGHLIRRKAGEEVDREWAVKNLYPKFVYIFSDVVCYVTRNPRNWTEIAVNLLDWAKIGAQHAINQYALPAAIVVLNGPPQESEFWISDDVETLTREFFKIIGDSIDKNAFIRSLASQYGVDNIQDLFLRSFSSVHVIYIPLWTYGNLGTDTNVFKQYGRLLRRIKNDADRVQASREESWTRFDVKQLSLAFHYAFGHLASRSPKPFDFGDCRSQTNLPETTQSHIAEFLKCSLRGDVHLNFSYASYVIGSCMVVRALREEGEGLLSHPDAIYGSDMKKVCQGAIEGFLDTGLKCNYVNKGSGERCVNTKDGHAKGHQNKDGELLEAGDYGGGGFDSIDFQDQMTKHISSFLQELNKSDPDQRHKLAHNKHRMTLQASSAWSLTAQAKESGTKTCFGCLFAVPDHKLPCEHLLCEQCVQDFDQSSQAEAYPSVATHNECLLCAKIGARKWPFRVRTTPPLGGLRILSMDGGGVRGIVQLVTLKRLESEVGLSLPIGAYFDLIVGTSAGGMIALGIGDHNWTSRTCMEKFEHITQNGLEAKMLTKNWVFGWIARYFRDSIYSSAPLEKVLQEEYGDHLLFGLDATRQSQTTRVAVTTTVHTECKLFTNYRRGGSGPSEVEYLDSQSCTWAVARSTSAAPMYFEPYLHKQAGVVCRDGGLRYNNPIQISLNEARAIWGAEKPFDAIVSIGSGTASGKPAYPASKWLIPDWLATMFHSFMATLSGEEHWKEFYARSSDSVKFRAKRLNVEFVEDQEPALDDTSKVRAMKFEANEFTFYKPSSHFSLTSPDTEDLIEEVALQLRASLFFFQPRELSFNNGRDIAVIMGFICCRLDSVSEAFKTLCDLTKGFDNPGPFLPMLSIKDCVPKFMLQVSFQHDTRLSEQPIKIEVQFNDGYVVPISGFPTTFKDIQKVMNRSF